MMIMPEETNAFYEMFNDSEQAARYANGPAKFMPGFLTFTAWPAY